MLGTNHVSDAGRPRRGAQTHLLVYLVLQLQNLVFHAHVELLEVLHGASLHFQLPQVFLGPPATHAALQQDHGGYGASVVPSNQPAPHISLDDHSFLIKHQLERAKQKQLGRRPSEIQYDTQSHSCLI